MCKLYKCCCPLEDDDKSDMEDKDPMEEINWKGLIDQVQIHFKNLEETRPGEPKEDTPDPEKTIVEKLATVDILKEIFSTEPPKDSILDKYFLKGDNDANGLAAVILKNKDRGKKVRCGVCIGLLSVGFIIHNFGEIKKREDQQITDDCYSILKESCRLAKAVKQMNYRKRRMRPEMRLASRLFLAGSILCWMRVKPDRLERRLRPSTTPESLTNHIEKLRVKYRRFYAMFDVYLYDAYRDTLPARPEESYPKDAVGIEEDVKDVIDVMGWANRRKAMVTIVTGESGSGKTTLADAVFATLELPRCNYSKITVFDNNESCAVMKQGHWVRFPREEGDVRAFIYIDNALKKEELQKEVKQLVRHLTNARKVRFLVTAKDPKDTIDWQQILPGQGSVVTYSVRPRNKVEAAQIFATATAAGKESLQDELKKNLKDDLQTNLRQVSKGSPGWIFLAAKYILTPNLAEGDILNRLTSLVSEENLGEGDILNRLTSLVSEENLGEGDILKLLDKFSLKKEEQEALEDICWFFHGYPWKHVQHIVGEKILKKLQEMGIIREANSRARVLHTIFKRFTEKSGDTRRVIASAKATGGSEKNITGQVTSAKATGGLEKNITGQLKGIVFEDTKEAQSERAQRESNTDPRDNQISSSLLSSMHETLRVLKVAEWSKINGICPEDFPELICYEGVSKTQPLPFQLQKAEKLKRLVYANWDGDFSFEQMPSGLEYLSLKGSQNPSRTVSMQSLQNLKSLSITLDCQNDVTLPDEILSLPLEEFYIKCSKLKQLPQNIEQWKNLQMLSLHCPGIDRLPVGFKKLTKLTELDLTGCTDLQSFSDDFFQVSALKTMHLGEFQELSKTYVNDIIKILTLRAIFLPDSWLVYFAGRDLPEYLMVYYIRN